MYCHHHMTKILQNCVRNMFISGGKFQINWYSCMLGFNTWYRYIRDANLQQQKKVFLEGENRIFWQKTYFFKIPKTNINLHMKFDPPHPTHFSSGTCRDRSPLHPAAVNATVCSLPLAMQLHARNLSINVALIMPKNTTHMVIITLFSCSASPVYTSSSAITVANTARNLRAWN